MSTSESIVARRKPFYHRIGASFQSEDGLSWRKWQEDEQGVELVDYDGDLTLKDKNVEALPIFESRGSFGGLTTPKGVTYLPGGVILLVDTNQQQILFHTPERQGFEPLWCRDQLDADSPYYLVKPVDLYFAPKGELVVCDSGKQQVVWFSWPELKVKHVERFCHHQPAAVCGSFAEGYTIALNPLSVDALTKNDDSAKLVRFDTSYQHCKTFTWLSNTPLHRVLAVAELADDSLLVLRCPQIGQNSDDIDDLANKKVWRLSRFLVDKVVEQWRVISIEGVSHSDELMVGFKLPTMTLQSTNVTQSEPPLDPIASPTESYTGVYGSLEALSQQLLHQSDLSLEAYVPLDAFVSVSDLKRLAYLPDGKVLMTLALQPSIWCDRYKSKHGNVGRGIEPLWLNEGLAQDSPYSLHNIADIYFSAKDELVVCDKDKQQVVWFSWPELTIKHIECFESLVPFAVCGSFANGYVIALETLQDEKRSNVTLLRIDSSYQHKTPIEIAAEVPLIEMVTMANLADGSLLLLQQSDEEARHHYSVIWHLTKFRFEQAARVWQIDGLDKITQLRQLDRIIEKDSLLPWQQAEHDCCLRSIALGEATGVSRQGTIEYMGNRLTLVSIPRRIRLKKSRRLISAPIVGDGDQFDWDRLVFEADILEHTSVVVQTKTSDRLLTDLELTESMHIPWSTAIRLDSHSSKQLLVQSKPGRYLYLSLSFYGDGYSAATIDAINIEAPRYSALQWLPPIYHQDQESRHFLDRYLSYFDVVFDEIGYQADHFARYLDPQSVPDEAFLDWLAGWFDWQFIVETPELTKRQIVSQLMSYYRMRGTADGLKLLLRWYTELNVPYPQIIEHFVFADFRDHGVSDIYLAGKHYDVEQHIQPHVFSILLPKVLVERDSADETEAAKLRLKRLIDAQKPAHCQCNIEYFSSHCVIGRQSTIGVDMVVGRAACDEANFRAVTYLD